MLRVLARLDASSPGRERLLQAIYPLPRELRPLTQRVEAANFDFQRLKYLRGSLKLTFTLVLSFAAAAVGAVRPAHRLGVARRPVAPIGPPAAAGRGGRRLP